MIITLIAILLMFLGSLLDGLIRSSTGAIRAQDADAIVYSSTAQASFPRSRIDADVRMQIEALPGVDEVGGIGLVQLGARVPGNGPRDLANVALFGYEIAPEGVPAPPPDGQAYADEILKADNVEEGMTILLGPARTPVEVIGFVSDTSFNGQGGLWASEATWRTTLAENRPDAQLSEGVWQALVVVGDDDVADQIDAATRRRNRQLHGRRGGQRHPGRRVAAGHLQPDHRCHDHRGVGRDRTVLRAAHGRTAQPVRRAEGARVRSR